MTGKEAFDRYPLLGEYGVVVCGDGPSGCVAAVAAARSGARALLVEQYGFLGEALTGQGVHPMMTFHAGERQMVRDIPDESSLPSASSGRKHRTRSLRPAGSERT